MPSGYFLFRCERICRYGMRIIGRTQPTVSAITRHQEPRIPADQICRTSPRVWLSSVHRRNARRASFAKRQPLTTILWLCGMLHSSNPHADRDLGSGFTRNALRGPFVARLQHAIFNETAKDGQARDDNMSQLMMSFQANTSLISKPTHPHHAFVFRFHVLSLQLDLSNLLLQPSRHNITTLHRRRDF